MSVLYYLLNISGCLYYFLCFSIIQNYFAILTTTPFMKCKKKMSIISISYIYYLCFDTGRKAFIGIGFADRGDSFDMIVSMQDHFKYVF